MDGRGRWPRSKPGYAVPSAVRSVCNAALALLLQTDSDTVHHRLACHTHNPERDEVRFLAAHRTSSLKSSSPTSLRRTPKREDPEGEGVEAAFVGFTFFELVIVARELADTAS